MASLRTLLAEGEEATEHFEEALRLRGDARPFDLPSIQLLLYGEHLRRQRRGVDARAHLRAALEGFERFRAEPWAERARAELRASGETVRKRDPSTLSQLTLQELQIAGLPILRARVERVRDVLQEAVGHRLAARGIGYLQGTACLGRARTVRVTSPDGVEHRLTARAVLVATGSRPTHFAGVPFDDPDVYDSDQVYSLRTVPEDIVVVGGGAIGVEFATVLTALGIPATLISRSDRLLPAVDGELAELAAKEFQRRGVRLILGADAKTVCRKDGRLTVTLSTGPVLTADAVLFATGRTPNTEGLGLEEADVRLDDRGRIAVDRFYRTTAPGIYAAGDVVDPGLASYAMQQGRAAAAHACGLMFGVVVDRTANNAVYGLPEVASAGATEEEVRAAGIAYAVGRCDLALTARGAIAGHGGLLKLIIRADDRTLLGVHCFGDTASEVVNLGHVVVQDRGRVESFLTLALNTPTYTYAFHDAAVDGLTQLSRLMGLADGGAPVLRHRE